MPRSKRLSVAVALALVSCGAALQLTRCSSPNVERARDESAARSPARGDLAAWSPASLMSGFSVDWAGDEVECRAARAWTTEGGELFAEDLTIRGGTISRSTWRAVAGRGRIVRRAEPAGDLVELESGVRIEAERRHAIPGIDASSPELLAARITGERGAVLRRGAANVLSIEGAYRIEIELGRSKSCVVEGSGRVEWIDHERGADAWRIAIEGEARYQGDGVVINLPSGARIDDRGDGSMILVASGVSAEFDLSAHGVSWLGPVGRVECAGECSLTRSRLALDGPCHASGAWGELRAERMLFAFSGSNIVRLDWWQAAGNVSLALPQEGGIVAEGEELLWSPDRERAMLLGAPARFVSAAEGTIREEPSFELGVEEGVIHVR